MFDGGGVPGEVDFKVHFYALAATMILNSKKVVGGPREAWTVGSFGGEVWEGRNHKGPRLGVGGVEVEAVKFVKGHGVQCSDDIFGGNIVSRDI